MRQHHENSLPVWDAAENEHRRSAKSHDSRLLSVAGLELLVFIKTYYDFSNWCIIIGYGLLIGSLMVAMEVAVPKCVYTIKNVRLTNSKSNSMPPLAAENTPTIAIEALSNSLQDFDIEQLSKLQQLKRRFEMLMLNASIDESDYFESIKEIDEVSYLVDEALKSENEILKSKHFVNVSEIFFKFLIKYDQQIDFDFRTDLELLASGFKASSIISEVVYYFYLSAEQDIYPSLSNKLKGLKKIENLVEDYYDYLPSEIVVTIKNIIDINLDCYLRFGSRLTPETLEPIKNTKIEKELRETDKQIKYVVGYIYSLLIEQGKNKTSFEASKYLSNLFQKHFIEPTLPDAIAKAYPDVKLPVGVIFFVCLVFSKPEIPVEEIVYQNLEKDRINIWTVMNNASREQRYIIYEQEKTCIRAFPDSLVDFRVIEVNNFHNEFGDIDNSYQRIAPPSHAE